LEDITVATGIPLPLFDIGVLEWSDVGMDDKKFAARY